MNTQVMRRTNAERTRTTKAKAVEAAIQCLVDRGYAGASTQVIARTAGISEGALFRHFPTKIDILAAALELVLFETRAMYAADFETLAPDCDHAVASVHILNHVFHESRMLVSYELTLAARTDDKLRAAIGPVLDDHWAKALEMGQRYFPKSALANPKFRDFVDLIFCVMQGSVYAAMARPRPDEMANRIAFLEGIAKAHLGFDTVSDKVA